MRDAARELTERLHLLRLRQLRAQGAMLLGRAPLLCDVGRDQQHALDLPVAQDRTDADVEPARVACDLERSFERSRFAALEHALELGAHLFAM